MFLHRQPVYAAQMTPQYSITAWDHKDGLPSTSTYALAQTGDGILWLGTADGLIRFDGMQFAPWRSIHPNEGLLSQVRALCVSSHGGLWLDTSAGRLGGIRDNHLQAISSHSAVMESQAISCKSCLKTRSITSGQRRKTALNCGPTMCFHSRAANTAQRHCHFDCGRKRRLCMAWNLRWNERAAESSGRLKWQSFRRKGTV